MRGREARAEDRLKYTSCLAAEMSPAFILPPLPIARSIRIW